MNFLHCIAALLFTLQVCAGLLIGAAPGAILAAAPAVAAPVVAAPVVAPAVAAPVVAPAVPAPVVAPAVAAPVIPAIHTVHTGLPEVRNTMLASEKEIGHFSATMHRSSDFGFPFAKKT